MRWLNLTSLLIVVLASSLCVAGAPEPASELVAPGLRHFVLERGRATTETTYRFQLGTFERQSEADAVLADLRAEGFAAELEASGSDYRLFSAGMPSLEKAEELRRRLTELGFKVAAEIEKTGQDLTNPEGPWRVHVLEADPHKVRVEIAHAYDAAIGLETTADLAIRHGALAAINGGYFRMKGLLAGDNQGALQLDGRLLSEPDRGRAAVGFFEEDGVSRAVFGRLSFRGAVTFGDGATLNLDGINRPRGSSEIILFTPEFHRTTLTHQGGAELILEDGRIVSIRNGAGSSAIPASGGVLSVGSERMQEVLEHAREGGTVSIETKIIPLLPDPEGEWERVEDISGAGPLLLWKGKRVEEPEKESISEVFFHARHPRTAVGAKADGTLVFVTVDGRRPFESVGMNLPELTDLLLELGCVSAVNLDGGGSTTMVVGGEIVNRPSGGSARENADAILIFRKD
jgi:exopolysaccharide biosynthesis protein